jgi:hypothetical protein
MNAVAMIAIGAIGVPRITVALALLPLAPASAAAAVLGAAEWPFVAAVELAALD